jgi:hypothetical protein
VIDLQPDERSASVRSTADVHVFLRQFDEVDDDVEFGEGGAAFVVESGDVFRDGFFRGVVFEGAFGVVDVPERHRYWRDVGELEMDCLIGIVVGPRD